MRIKWSFPIEHCHAGIPLGNATSGLEIHGAGNRLKLTLGRADFWDHRGGMPWTDKQNYRDILAALTRGDAEEIQRMFASESEGTPGMPPRPTIMPVGRIDVVLPENVLLKYGILDTATALAVVEYDRDGISCRITFQMDMDNQIFHAVFPESGIKMESVPAWNGLADYLNSISIAPPEMLDGRELHGWIQTLPDDPALCVGYVQDGNELWCGTLRGRDIASLKQGMADELSRHRQAGAQVLSARREAWWKNYWASVPEISVPSPVLTYIYHFGLYKFGCFTNPSGVPATLQGPWIEDNRMPPWSSDYHFNINVQMCYWPALKINKAEHLRPLLEMVWSWRDKLAVNARSFIGIDDGYILPHAVDDRGTCMGNFWTGTVDHACTAWVAAMMHDYFLFTGDRRFLAEIAFPFMKGAMRVYEEMLEEYPDGTLHMPLTVSPEYRGARMDAWGADASFQLAAVRQLAERLIDAASVLGEDTDSGWRRIIDKLPVVTLTGEDNRRRIALWKGLDLEESHRHFSHLAGICPFDVIDPQAEEWRAVVSATVDHWVEKGMGQWSGWSMPWASMLHSRCGNGDMAALLLEIWRRVYVNAGHGTLHDAAFAGFTLMGPGTLHDKAFSREIMQMDAGMGCISAVRDMLLHSRRGVIHVFPALPSAWKNVSFSNMPVAGGFFISASMTDGIVNCVEVRSSRNGVCRLSNPFGKQSVSAVFSDGARENFGDAIFEITLSADVRVMLKP